MICNDALKLLKALDDSRGKRIELKIEETLQLGELESNGYVSRVNVEAFNPDELAKSKLQLGQLQESERENRKRIASFEFPGWSAGSEICDTEKLKHEIEAAILQERRLRDRILTLSELSAKKDRSVSFNGIQYIITYKGKELAKNLESRINRIGNKQVSEFEQEMTVLNNTFFSWAKRSFEILKYLSPRTLQIDEIHCRSVVVGLSARPETAREISDAFAGALESIGKILKDHDRLPSIAECIIISLKDLSKESISSAISRFNDIKELVRKYASDDDAAIDCALLLHPLDHSTQDNDLLLEMSRRFVSKMVNSNMNPDAALEAVLLIEVIGLELNEEIMRKFQDSYNELYDPTIPARNTGIAAALIVIGISKGQQIHSRFKTALNYLNRFSEEPMIVPAAMLSHLSPEIEETLDTLRMASFEIARQKLSPGGMENLSLGMKMLLQSSIISSIISIPPELRKQYVYPGEMIPLQTLGILSLSMLPVALTAFIAFHELSIHKLIVSDYSFHPIHTNYGYG